MRLRPPFPQGRPQPRVKVHRYLIYPVAAGRLPQYQLAQVALRRVLPQIERELRPFVTFGSNGKGGFLLEAPEKLKVESAVAGFLFDLDSLSLVT